MQQLAKETISPSAALDSAEQILEVVPLIMRRIRHEMRKHTMAGLTIVQFRALNYIGKHPDVSLKDVADHLGLTPPTTSKLINKLVVGKVIKSNVASDRRRVCLSLTKSGIKALAVARAETRQQLANILNLLSQEEMVNVSTVLRTLDNVFSQGGNNFNLS